MKTSRINLFWLAVPILLGIATRVFADDFPQAYIKDQLARAAQGVSIDITELKAGELISVQYVERPVFIYRRTRSDIKSIESAPEAIYADPIGSDFRAAILHEYGSSSSAVWARLLLSSRKIAMTRRFRSIKPDLAIIAGWSPVSGCLLGRIEAKSRTIPGAIFTDPCTGAKFDSAGRIFLEQPSTAVGNRSLMLNVAIPPYHIDKNGKIKLGLDDGEILPDLNFSRDELYSNKEPTMVLLTAARYNDIDTVRAALEQGAKADYFKEGVGSPIDAACIGSSMEIIKLLVAHGARKTPHTLNAATFVGRKDLVTYLNSLPE